MIDGFLRMATAKAGLDGDVIGLTVDLRKILIENLGVTGNDRTDNVRVLLEGLCIGHGRAVDEAYFGFESIILLGGCRRTRSAVHATEQAGLTGDFDCTSRTTTVAPRTGRKLV